MRALQHLLLQPQSTVVLTHRQRLKGALTLSINECVWTNINGW